MSIRQLALAWHLTTQQLREKKFVAIIDEKIEVTFGTSERGAECTEMVILAKY